MNGWIIHNDNSFDWTSRWNKWIFNLFTVGYDTAYNKDNKNKWISICRP